MSRRPPTPVPRRGRRPPILGGAIGQQCAILAAIGLLTLLLAVLFSSPDERPVTIRGWSRRAPVGFLTTAIAELAGTSQTAEYGPPYNHGSGSVQHAAFIHLQQWLGVSDPIDTAQDYVIRPVRGIPDPTLQAQIAEYEESPYYLKADAWDGFEKALLVASVGKEGSVVLRGGEYENVDNIMRALLGLAQSGALDGDLLRHGAFLQTDYTRSLLLLDDGGALQERARVEHAPEGQWAMMNETGSYPGLALLWPYAVWHSVEPLAGSSNRDLLAMLVGAALSLLLVLVPFLPAIRDLPRWIPVHRLIWREG